MIGLLMSLVMALVCILVHFEALMVVQRIRDRMDGHRTVMIAMWTVLLSVHVLQVWLFAVAYVLGCQWQLGELEFSLQATRVLQGALQDGNRCVTAAVRAGREVIDIWPGLKERLYGLAIDVGSTTLAAHFCDLRTGELLASSGAMNPQIRFGEDLISRVSYVMAHPGAEQALSIDVRIMAVIIFAVTGLLFLALIITGALLSINESAQPAILRTHQVAPLLVLFSTAVSIFLLVSSTPLSQTGVMK